jgi:hypothetical protein
VLEIAYRCPDGQPGVVTTAPRLPDGTPFPTLYYLTHPALTAAASRLESEGVMREMTERLTHDPEVAAAYRRAHESYLAERDAIEPLGTTFSGGGMPDRVKCLHVLMAHALAKGRGVNPFGDEALAMVAAGQDADAVRLDREIRRTEHAAVTIRDRIRKVAGRPNRPDPLLATGR